ncbi:MAG TPA: PfkB family carbohydrate kinase [Thermoanaerobaculaceae bacterium]|nr:PfkB family carbohydrate kinase [Thermoanaerobaculaceae bacterium]
MTARARLHGIIDRFASRRVVLYGDLVLDRFVLGTPKRISREAPVIILRFESQRDLPGGGANALANLAALGATVLPVGVVGDDEAGASLLAVLARSGVDVSGIVRLPSFRTVTKVRVLAGGAASLKHQIARYDVEDHLPAHDGWRDELDARLAAVAPNAHAAAVSDYGYGVVFAEAVARLRAALPAGAPVVADSRFGLDALGSVDGATPNLEELAATAGEIPRGDDAVASAAEALRGKLGARFVAATRGSEGLTLVEAGKAAVHLPVYGTDQVADVTGAGDTVLATLTIALAAGAEPPDAAVLANLAGGVVVTKLGTATVSRDELHRAVDLAPFVHD